jgi:energy-coupling factor transporter ATP-binding protein EcfA2
VENFKAFDKFSLSLGDDAFLVGPNNAGKSTLISALKACAYMLRHASSKAPSTIEIDRGRQVHAYPLQEGSFGLLTENLRHEFRDVESRVELGFKGGASLTAVWPVKTEEAEGSEIEEDEDDYYEFEVEQEEVPNGFFYLFLPTGMQPQRPVDVRRGFPSLGVIPILTPIQLRESLLSRDHVRANVDGRLASRHFRNQLYWYTVERNAELEFDTYRELVQEWQPDFALQELRVQPENIDLFYEESGSRVPKEISWAGDGVQVWLQILLHVLRLREHATVVLDEPDVYLHPDLQRKLVRLLESQSCQTITATHSSEVLAESSPSRVIWVDKTRARATRAPSDHLLTQLTRSLGSQFNLRLARALRTRVALFFEGDDMKLFRNLAQTAGATLVATETGVTTIPIEGYTNWSNVEAFAWLAKDLLRSSVSVMLTLDRDYRSDSATRTVVRTLKAAGIDAHIWERHELESYLLVPAAIARVSKAPADLVESWLEEIVDDLRPDIFAGMHFEHSQEKRKTRDHQITVTQKFAKDFERAWADKGWRLKVAPAKETLTALNQRLQESGHKAASSRALSRALRRQEMDDELIFVLGEAEAHAASND